LSDLVAESDAGWVQGSLLASATCMLVLSISATLPIIPAMLHAFRGQPGIDMLVPFAVVAPMLTLALTGPLAGTLGDRVGRRRLLDLSTLVFAIVAVLPFWLGDFVLIVVSRVVLGVALGAMMTSAVGLTGDYFSGASRVRWLSIQGAAGAATAVVAASVSGALAEVNWRLSFLMLAAGFPLFLALVLFRGPATAVGAGESNGAATPDAQPVQWRVLAAIFALSVVASLTLWPPAYALGVLLEEKRLGASMVAGIATSVLAAGAVVGSMSVGLLKSISMRVMQAVAFALGVAGASAIWTATGLPLLMSGAFAVGAGEGIVAPVLSTVLLAETPVRLRGRTVGLYQTTFFLAQFAGPLIAQVVAKSLGSTSVSMLYDAVACAATLAIIAIVAASRRARIPITVSGH